MRSPGAPPKEVCPFFEILRLTPLSTPLGTVIVSFACLCTKPLPLQVLSNPHWLSQECLQTRVSDESARAAAMFATCLHNEGTLTNRLVACASANATLLKLGAWFHPRAFASSAHFSPGYVNRFLRPIDRFQEINLQIHLHPLCCHHHFLPQCQCPFAPLNCL